MMAEAAELVKKQKTAAAPNILKLPAPMKIREVDRREEEQKARDAAAGARAIKEQAEADAATPNTVWQNGQQIVEGFNAAEQGLTLKGRFRVVGKR